MTQQRERPVRRRFPKRIERAADGSGVWFDKRLVRWSELRAIGFVTVTNVALDELTYAVFQLTDGTHAWWLVWRDHGGSPMVSSEVDGWLRTLVTPGIELPEVPCGRVAQYDRGGVLWPASELGQDIYEERPHRVLGFLWREPAMFARLR